MRLSACQMEMCLPQSTQGPLRATRRFRSPAAIAGGLLLIAVSTASAQLRDSFEGPQPTWSLREADCGVRLLAHERTYRVSQSGQASEHLRMVLGNGTFAYLAQPIGKAPVIREFQPSLFVKADKANVQLLARVVFPRSIDRGTGQPVSSWLRLSLIHI